SVSPPHAASAASASAAAPYATNSRLLMPATFGLVSLLELHGHARSHVAFVIGSLDRISVSQLCVKAADRETHWLFRELRGCFRSFCTNKRELNTRRQRRPLHTRRCAARHRKADVRRGASDERDRTRSR